MTEEELSTEVATVLSGGDASRFSPGEHHLGVAAVLAYFGAGAPFQELKPGDLFCRGRLQVIERMPAAVPKYLVFDRQRRVGLTATFFPGGTLESFCRYTKGLRCFGEQDQYNVFVIKAGLCKVAEEPLTMPVEPRDHPIGTLAAYLPFLGLISRAHACGLVHGSIRPDAMVLSQTDFAYRLLDCGVAQVVAKPVLSSYAAPEQLEGKEADQRSDQFSLCAVMWEAAFGEHPFDGQTVEALQESIATSRRRDWALPKGVPSQVIDVLEKGLSANPADRFDSMACLRDSLSDSLQQGMDEAFKVLNGLDQLGFAPPVLESISLNGEGRVLWCPGRPRPTGNEVNGKWLDLESTSNPLEEGALIAQLLHLRVRRSEWNSLAPESRGVARDALVNVINLQHAWIDAFFPEPEMEKTSAKARTHVIDPFLRHMNEKADNEYAETVDRRTAWTFARNARSGFMRLLKRMKKEGLPSPDVRLRQKHADEINLFLRKSFLRPMCDQRDLEANAISRRDLILNNGTVSPMKLANYLLAQGAGISVDDLVRPSIRERVTTREP